jgi:type IV pilus assembly protein PilW
MSPLSRERQWGMSLVELMVGMAVGLIGITIISHLYITNEKYKRSTTGSGTAQVNGAIALYTLERDIRMAGFGLNHSGALGCSCDKVANPDCSSVQYWYNGTYSSPPGPAGGALPPLEFAPVVIKETPNLPDTITLLYGNDPERMLPGKLTESMPQPSSEFKVDGTAGYTINDMVLVTNGSTCMMTQVTQVQDAASHLQHNPGASLWNPAGGGSSLPAFPGGSNLFNLGNPIWRTYSVEFVKKQLQFREVISVTGGPTAPAAAIPIIDDIVDVQAQYGKDTDDNGSVETWNTVQPTSGAQWQQVLAIRVAVLARSPNWERPSVAGGACEATTTANRPKWGDVATGLQDFPTLMVAGELPSCYKYRVFETIIPLRNMIWRPA